MTKKREIVPADKLLDEASKVDQLRIGKRMPWNDYLAVVDKLMAEKGYTTVEAFAWVAKNGGLSRHSLGAAYYRRRKQRLSEGGGAK